MAALDSRRIRHVAGGGAGGRDGGGRGSSSAAGGGGSTGGGGGSGGATGSGELRGADKAFCDAALVALLAAPGRAELFAELAWQLGRGVGDYLLKSTDWLLQVRSEVAWGAA